VYICICLYTCMCIYMVNIRYTPWRSHITGIIYKSLLFIFMYINVYEYLWIHTHMLMFVYMYVHTYRKYLLHPWKISYYRYNDIFWVYPYPYLYVYVYKYVGIYMIICIYAYISMSVYMSEIFITPLEDFLLQVW
jgi:hypothetical protein